MLAVTLLLLLGLGFGGKIFLWSSPKFICLLVFGEVIFAFCFFSEKSLDKYLLVPLYMFKNWPKNAPILVAFAYKMASIGIEECQRRTPGICPIMTCSKLC
jgi:hypothetical protein